MASSREINRVAVYQLTGILILSGLFVSMLFFFLREGSLRMQQNSEEKAFFDSVVASIGNGDALSNKIAERVVFNSTFQKAIKNYSTQSSQEAFQAMMGQIARGNTFVADNVIGEMQKNLLETIQDEGLKLKNGIFTPKETTLIKTTMENLVSSVISETKKSKNQIMASVPRIQVPVAPPPSVTDIQGRQNEAIARLDDISRKVDSLLLTSKNSVKLNESSTIITNNKEKDFSQIREMIKDLSDQVRFQARNSGSVTTTKQNKSRCFVLNWSKSLNVSPDELEYLVAEIKSIKGIEPTSSTNNSFLLIQDFDPKKVIKPFTHSEKALNAFLSGPGPSDRRPLADDIPAAVVEQVSGSAVGIDTLVLITGHDFRFKKEDLVDWNRFKTLLLVLIEGPIAEYFEWTHISKLKTQRQKVPGNFTDIRIFKKQNDRGLTKDEVRDLVRVINQSLD